MQISTTTWKRILGLGALSGLRGSGGLAVLSWTAAHGGYPALKRTPLSILGTHKAAYATAFALFGESVADKVLATTPARYEPAGLASRAVSGALIGALVSATEDVPLGIGITASIGAATITGAAVSATRVWATRTLGVPDAVIGLVEDAVVISGIDWLRRSAQQQADDDA